jgi:hypothetical protein
MERWSVERRAFSVETYLKKQRFSRSDSADISSALKYFSERQCLYLQYCTAVGEKLKKISVCRKKENLPEGNLHLELLRTSKECVRFLSEILGDQQADMSLH